MTPGRVERLSWRLLKLGATLAMPGLLVALACGLSGALLAPTSTPLAVGVGVGLGTAVLGVAVLISAVLFLLWADD